ncbi:hypothetical protein ACFQXB_04855 [Plastorhodobacter daqingensis]|uniref:Sulfotransferase family protein n=1 Tax=Plastorhodobacter daqingensis TaxID=1387281 RepID=A0ABW2UHM5_9RHOB
MMAAIYACYGMPKSGSTLAFEMTLAVLELGGIPQRRLSREAIPGETGANVLPLFRPVYIKAALREIGEAGHPRPIAIRTHGGVWQITADTIAAGQMIGQAVARDPRDLALSLLDSARFGGAWGTRDGQPLATLDDAMEIVRGHVHKFRQWQSQPGFLTLNYEELAFKSHRAVARIAAQLEIEVDPRQVLSRIERRFTQLNKGVSQRWRDEMPPEVANRYYDEFAEFIETWCLPPGLPGRV